MIKFYKQYKTSSYLELTILSLLWAPSAACIKITLPAISALSIVAISSSIAAIFLIIYTSKYCRAITTASFTEIWQGLILGFFGHGLPFTLLTYSMYFMQSIWAGILNAIIPLLTALLAHFVLPNEKINLQKLKGIMLGFIGITILTVASIFDKNTGTKQFTGILLSLASTVSCAIGIILAKKTQNTRSSPIFRSTLHVLTSNIYLLPLALILDPPMAFTENYLYEIFCLLFLGIAGTGMAFIVYYRIVIKHGSIVLSMVNYLLPINKTIIGILILGEQITAAFCVAAICILLGLKMVLAA